MVLSRIVDYQYGTSEKNSKIFLTLKWLKPFLTFIDFIYTELTGVP
jgi:hypothetical protein